MDCTETLLLLEGSLSYRHQQVRKARGMKILSFCHGSSLKQSVERPCEYQGDNLAEGSDRPSHESLREKLLISGHQVLHWVVIDKDARLNGPEILHT